MFSPVMTLITKTSVVTARMTPSKVRKLRSLCARRASIANFNVSTIVTQAVRMPAALDGLLVAARGAISVIRPMGVTPKQTSNLLCLIRVRSSNRSLLCYIDVRAGTLLSAFPGVALRPAQSQGELRPRPLLYRVGRSIRVNQRIRRLARPQGPDRGFCRAYVRLPGGVPRWNRVLRAEIHSPGGSDACGKVHLASRRGGTFGWRSFHAYHGGELRGGASTGHGASQRRRS